MGIVGVRTGSRADVTVPGARTTNCWVQYNVATVVNGVVQPPTILYHGVQITNAASETAVNADLRQQC